MVTLAASPSLSCWSPGGGISSPVGGSCGLAAMSSSGHLSLRKRTKLEVCEAFIQKLRERGTIDLDAAGVVEGLDQHFQLLPTRYALDVNISSLDVLNHKRLLDSARADPSAVSFQVRPVDVVLNQHGNTAVDRRPSFGNVDSFLMEVGIILAVALPPNTTSKLLLTYS